jgi:rubrerythrin
MSVYEYAMQLEKDGVNSYRELVANCQIKDVKIILTMLANEKMKHFNTIAQLQKHAGKYSLAETTVFEDVKNIFFRMKDEKIDIRFDSSDFEAFRKAMAIEKMSWEFYQEKAANAGGEDVKQIFWRLAGEGEKHFRIMENIVEFVSRSEPGNWLENFEWRYLGGY